MGAHWNRPSPLPRWDDPRRVYVLAAQLVLMAGQDLPEMTDEARFIAHVNSTPGVDATDAEAACLSYLGQRGFKGGPCFERRHEAAERFVRNALSDGGCVLVELRAQDGADTQFALVFGVDDGGGLKVYDQRRDGDADSAEAVVGAVGDLGSIVSMYWVQAP